MSSKSIPFEKFKEDWQRQLMANSTLSPVTLRVGIAISWHMNRKKGGLAFPGMAQLARIARTTPRTVISSNKAIGGERLSQDHSHPPTGTPRPKSLRAVVELVGVINVIDDNGRVDAVTR